MYQFNTYCKDDVIISLQKTAKIFWVTLDVAVHGPAYGRPMRSPIQRYPKDFLLF